MMTSEKWQEIKAYRNEIGKEILVLMESEEDLPMPNVYRVASTMQEYFTEEGFSDRVKADGYTWQPTEKYWRIHMGEIAKYMREEYQFYFGFKRDQHKLTGQWKFMEPEEWDSSMKRDHKDIGKRIDTHNGKLEDSIENYKVEIPHLTEAPLLT